MKKDKLRNLVKNNQGNNFYYLPPSSIFCGGVVDFTEIASFKKDDFDGTFTKTFVRTAPAFAKDMMARFSSYYARQGQPDFDFDALAEELIGVVHGS